MASIVSGQQEQENPGFAFLAGYEGARKQRVEEQQAQQAMQMRQMQLMLQMQDAGVRHAYQKAKTQELLNQQASAGDLASLQELSLRSQMDPEHAQAEQALGILQNIKDPEMRKEAAGHIKQVIQAQRAQKAYAGVGDEINRAMEDGLIDETGVQTYQQRLQAKQQSGESPDDILTEFSSARQKRAADAANSEENMSALEQAQQLIQTAKPGRNRKLAEIALKEFEMSPSRQREEGAGQKMLGAVQKTLVGSAKEYDEANAKKQFADLSPMSGPGGEQFRMKELESSFADYPQFAARKNAQKVGRYPEGAGEPNPKKGQARANVPRGTSDPQEMAKGIGKVWAESYGDANAVVDAAKEMGLDVEDPRVQAFIQEVLSGVTSGDSR